MTITVKIITSGNVEERLRAMELKLQPEVVGAWMVGGPVTDFLKHRATERFNNEGDDVVGVWEALSHKTEEIREYLARVTGWAIGPAHPINVRSGGMREWVTANVAGGAPDGEGFFYKYPGDLPLDSSGKAFSVGPKLQTAQHGRDDPSTTPRPVLGVNDFDAEIIAGMFKGYLDGND